MGSCWIGAFDNEKVQRLLGIPDNVDPEIIITLGYSDDMKAPQIREKIKFLSYHEKWGAIFKTYPAEPKQVEEKLKSEIDVLKKKLSKIKKK